MEVLSDVELDVDFDYRLTGKLIDIDMKVLEFKPYFFSHTDKQRLESNIEILERIAGESYLKEILKEGMEVPVPEWMLATMQQPTVTAYDGYIVFASQPKGDKHQ